MKTPHYWLLSLGLIACGDLRYTSVDLSFVHDASVNAGDTVSRAALADELERIVIDIATEKGKVDIAHLRTGDILVLESRPKTTMQIRSMIDQIRVQAGLEPADWELKPLAESKGDKHR